MRVDQNTITEKTTFSEVNADSLDVVEVIMAVETKFNIALADEEVEKFKNVGDLANFVASKVK